MVAVLFGGALVSSPAWASDEGGWPIVRHLDGAWSYAAPSHVSLEPREGPFFRMVYDGQQRFTDRPMAAKDFTFMAAPEEGRGSLTERIGDLIWVDENGSRWRAEALRGEEADAFLAELDVQEGLDHHEAVAAALPRLAGRDHDDALGAQVRWTPLSWTFKTCGLVDGDGNPARRGLAVWNTEDRVALDHSQLTARQKAVVQLLAVGGSCSGVLIRQDFVLTAAHCVTDEDGDLRSPISVCRQDVTACRTAAGVLLPAAWQGDGANYVHDWAVLRLNGSSWAPFGDAERMNLSGHSDSVLGGLHSVRNIGLPFRVLNANGGCDSVSGMHRVYNPDPIVGVQSDHLRLHADVTQGQSGSPFFFCPQNGDHQDCADGEPGVVFGVASGTRFVGLSWRVVSPKIADWRDDILLWINTF